MHLSTGVLGDCRFHTVTTGGGRGKPLMLFLHGFPELWYSWRRQLENFADDFEVGACPTAGLRGCVYCIGRFRTAAGMREHPAILVA